MNTRRDALMLAATVPFLTTAAIAQDMDMVKTMFTIASDYLNVPQRVHEKYAQLAYYLELLRRYPPKGGGFTPQHLSDATKTYELLGEAIAKSNDKFDGTAAKMAIDSLIGAYAKSQPILWGYLTQIGIAPKSPADVILEEAIASMMFFYAVANKITDALQLKWCIFPFCFQRAA
jgi:hypothetical protein